MSPPPPPLQPGTTPDGSPSPARDLVVAFAFPPYVDTAGVVAAKRVLQAGRPVDVIANDMSAQRALDPALEQIAGPLVRRREALATPTLFSSWKGVTTFADEGLAVATAWAGEGARYDRLYSRAHWVPSHVLAARLRARWPHVRWTAEFSDPLSLYADGRERVSPAPEGPLREELEQHVRDAGFHPPGDDLFAWVELLPYALADELVFTNPHQRDLMVRRIGDPRLAARVRERSVVEPHPTLPESFYSLTDPLAEGRMRLELAGGRRNIGYFGNFYPNRGLGTVLRALSVLPPALRDRLRLHVFTGDQEDLRRRAAVLGIEEVVEVQPFAGYLDFLSLSTRMDVLVVNDAVTAKAFPVNPFLPSKWSDYRGSGRPVWGIVEEGSVLGGQPLAYRSPVQHVSATVQVLAEIALS